jgi:DNA-binding NtrC family response regulator
MTTKLIKALIVDDDLTILTLLEEAFAGDPTLEIMALSDSEEAYRVLANESFDLIISDLMMPKVDGLQLLQRAKEINPSVLVVIITGYASLETTLEAIHAGVYDYITKPFRIEEFRLLVHNVAARIRLTREVAQLKEENRDLKTRIRVLQARLSHEQSEVRRLTSELERQQELLVRVGGGSHTPSDIAQRFGLTSYEKGSETSDERYDREFRRLQDLFSTGRLTSAEFDQARERLNQRASA